MAVVTIEDLTYYYPGTEKPALENINLVIPEGQFVLVVGASGSGKSSLIRAVAGLIPDFFGGTCGGSILLDNIELRRLDRRSLVQKVGTVFQDPEAQMVMTSVEQEIAFGLENLGLPPSLMQRRMMEVSSALSLSKSWHRFVPELSGGEKQKVALASVLAMQPEILLLDEPTSQLDPVAGEEILTTLRRLNEETGMTVILSEQRLERCFHLADRILVMEEGHIVWDHCVSQPMTELTSRAGNSFLPPVARLFASAGCLEVPLTVKQGRRLLKSYNCASVFPAPATVHPQKKPAAVQTSCSQDLLDIQDLWFTYPQATEALRGVNLRIQPAEFVVLMGENGAGKTTLLKNINGLLRPSRGQVRILGRNTRKVPVEELAATVGYLSQYPGDYLFLPTVEKEIAFTLHNLGLRDDGIGQQLLTRLNLTGCVTRNPRDLSSGERQRVALASVLAARPKLLLLDEPTRGLDYRLKEELGNILLELKAEGTAILMVTHDVEFAAEYADDIVLMANGSIIGRGSKYEMLTGSTFYSPQVSKLFNNIVPGVVTLDQAREVLTHLTGFGKNRALVMLR
ncbi:MAG: energy-coupling factor ABC transporter ATP-binding protein [Syntrophomonadaceae bacterium]|nr:energy-coupling factor ABC transporter ATP-binding protein [Syntrophomonadaceae bacterium]